MIVDTTVTDACKNGLPEDKALWLALKFSAATILKSSLENLPHRGKGANFIDSINSELLLGLFSLVCW